MKYVYDQAFYSYIQKGALSSARIIVPLVKKDLSVSSVLDVGCGCGAWLKIWAESGIEDYLGVDGDYVNTSDLMIPLSHFYTTNLAEPLNLNRAFGLVQSLEVGEHVPETRSLEFVKNLCRHGSIILFSAAPPGQGGENHINEKPYAFWRALFNQQGYDLYDPFRKILKQNRHVEPWYRYNMFLYIKRGEFYHLPISIERAKIMAEQPPDVSPLSYKLRKRLIRMLPARAVLLAAILKKNFINYTRKLRSSVIT